MTERLTNISQLLAVLGMNCVVNYFRHLIIFFFLFKILFHSLFSAFFERVKSTASVNSVYCRMNLVLNSHEYRKNWYQ